MKFSRQFGEAQIQRYSCGLLLLAATSLQTNVDNERWACAATRSALVVTSKAAFHSLLPTLLTCKAQELNTVPLLILLL